MKSRHLSGVPQQPRVARPPPKTPRSLTGYARKNFAPLPGPANLWGALLFTFQLHSLLLSLLMENNPILVLLPLLLLLLLLLSWLLVGVSRALLILSPT